jgi:hypothetical protein
MIDLPRGALTALGFAEPQSGTVQLKVVPEGVLIAPAGGDQEIKATKVSPGGLLKLSKPAHQALADGGKGRYSLEINAGKQSILLHRA